MSPRFRADQVGSLIRPQSLLLARGSSTFYSSSSSAGQVAATREAVAQVVAKQLELSIRPITSGEYERTIFFDGFFEALDGMEVRSSLRIPEDFRPGLPNVVSLKKHGVDTFAGIVAVDRIKHTTSAYLSTWEMMKEVVPEEHWKDCKMCIPSITLQHMYLAKSTAYSSQVYASDRAYFLDLAVAFRAEIHTLYEAGLRSVQVDDPNLTFFISEEFREGLRQDGIDPDEQLELYIWAHNQALKDLPPDLDLGIHLCRGNIPGGYAQGSYDKIAQQVFAKLNYPTFYLEFDDPSVTGDFEALRHIPQGKHVVLGLVSTKMAELEELDVLTRRVQEAAEVMARGQGRELADVLADSVSVSPQCGFASHYARKGVETEERMWEKLTLVRDLARSIWSDAV